MARNASYRWQNERKRGLVGPGLRVKGKGGAKRQAKGITNRQARFLADLQRQLGVRYTGDGMTKREASEAIDNALKRLGRPANPPRGQGER